MTSLVIASDALAVVTRPRPDVAIHGLDPVYIYTAAVFLVTIGLLALAWWRREAKVRQDVPTAVPRLRKAPTAYVCRDVMVQTAYTYSLRLTTPRFQPLPAGGTAHVYSEAALLRRFYDTRDVGTQSMTTFTTKFQPGPGNVCVGNTRWISSDDLVFGAC